MPSAPLVVARSGKMKLYNVPFVGRFFNSRPPLHAATGPSAYLLAATGSRGPTKKPSPSKQQKT